jgi:hypothetical protein
MVPYRLQKAPHRSNIAAVRKGKTADGNQFDALSRGLARTPTRRNVVRRVGGGGMLAVAAGAVGLRGRATAAQEASPAAGKGRYCAVPFEATIRQGPSAGQHFAGLLELVVTGDGAIDDAVFTISGGKQLAAKGQANGRAINLLIQAGDGRYLYGVGVADEPVATCPTVMGGPFVGPMEGDSEDWISPAIAEACDRCLKGCTDQRPGVCGAQCPICQGK